MKELSEQSGVRFLVHDLRRSCGNRLWRRGVPIETIAMILRHKDSGTTFKAYIGVQSDDMRKAIDSLSGSPPEDLALSLEDVPREKLQEVLEQLLELTRKSCPIGPSQTWRFG
jgi:DNA-binding transcriptional MerR regulator